MRPTQVSSSHAVPGAKPVLAKLTAVYAERKITVPKNLSREFSFLVFSLVADLSGGGSEGRIGCSQSWL